MLRLNWYDTELGWQHDHVDTSEDADVRVAEFKATSNAKIPTYSVQGCWEAGQKKYVKQDGEQ